MSKEKRTVTQISPNNGYQGISVKDGCKRNDKCPCGSGKKVKNCHLEYLEKKYYSINKVKDTFIEKLNRKRDNII
ncbi:MAG: SEC-C domain-containing protein [Prevotellaceae bacterium]|jgi:hypothetical protein|nr:SEC-C domain-containing protein [Prevotellaceae bacterium]